MDDFVYYFIMHDLNRVGKMEDYAYYIYEKERGWIPDNEHLLSDRLMGYDGLFVGSLTMLSRVDEISEEEANKMINLM
jgi:hypothetical protein